MVGFRFEEAIALLVTYLWKKTHKKPTLAHSIRVGSELFRLEYCEDVQIAGLFHDILEDTDLSEEQIEEQFGTRVLGIVKANTKNMSLPKADILEDIVSRCTQLGREALIVKIVDVYDNFLFYVHSENISEIERCKHLARIIDVHRLPDWNDIVFERTQEILTYPMNVWALSIH